MQMYPLSDSGEEAGIPQPKQKHMEPLSFFSIVSFTAMAVSNYWTGAKNRKLTRELEAKRVKEKKISDREAHQRALELQENGIQGDIIKTELNTNYDSTQIWNKRGQWLKTVAPNAKEPIVIFDTTIRNSNTKEENFAFNPMESLCHSFQRQTDEYARGSVYTTSVSKEFKSKSAVEAFYNDELPDVAAIIVYGSFDGNFLRINAVYGGMSIEQHVFDEQLNPIILECTPQFINLAEIPVNVLSKATDSLTVQSEIQSVYIKLQKVVIDLIANTALQTLIDCYFSLHSPYYVPLVGLEPVLEESEKLGLQIDEMKRAIEKHRSNVFEQRDRIQSLRLDYQNNFINKTF